MASLTQHVVWVYSRMTIFVSISKNPFNMGNDRVCSLHTVADSAAAAKKMIFNWN